MTPSRLDDKRRRLPLARAPVLVADGAHPIPIVVAIIDICAARALLRSRLNLKIEIGKRRFTLYRSNSVPKRPNTRTLSGMVSPLKPYLGPCRAGVAIRIAALSNAHERRRPP